MGISGKFDSKAAIAPQVAKEALGILLSEDICQNTLKKAFRIIDQVALEHRIDVTLELAYRLKSKDKSLKNAALEKALETLKLLPPELAVSQSLTVLKKAPLGTAFQEKALDAALNAIDSIKGKNKKVEHSVRLYHELYDRASEAESSPLLRSLLTRSLTHAIVCMEKSPKYPYKENAAGLLIAHASNVDPDKQEELRERLFALAPDARKRWEDAAARFAAVARPEEPKKPAPSAEALALVRKIQGMELK